MVHEIMIELWGKIFGDQELFPRFSLGEVRTGVLIADGETVNGHCSKKRRIYYSEMLPFVR